MVAVKKILVDLDSSEVDIDQRFREVELLITFDHHNIIGLWDNEISRHQSILANTLSRWGVEFPWHDRGEKLLVLYIVGTNGDQLGAIVTTDWPDGWPRTRSRSVLAVSNHTMSPSHTRSRCAAWKP